MSDGLTRIGAARDAVRRAFIAACRHAVDEGKVLRDSELVGVAHDAMDRLIPVTTGAAAVVAPVRVGACPVCGKPATDGPFCRWHEGPARSVVEALLQPETTPSHRRAKAILTEEWHDPTAAYRVAGLSREWGFDSVKDADIGALFVEVLPK